MPKYVICPTPQEVGNTDLPSVIVDAEDDDAATILANEFFEKCGDFPGIHWKSATLYRMEKVADIQPRQS